MQTPAPVDYVRATSVADALSLLQQHGDEARLLAGGHSLLPMMKLRLARPEILVDINDLDELRGIRVDGNEIVIGAMVTHAEILNSPILFEHYPIFREAEKVIADPIVRNKGTMGGSMCQAQPLDRGWSAVLPSRARGSHPTHAPPTPRASTRASAATSAARAAATPTATNASMPTAPGPPTAAHTRVRDAAPAHPHPRCRQHPLVLSRRACRRARRATARGRARRPRRGSRCQ